MKATDKDHGENGQISYHFKVGNENVQETEEFAINADTGELRAKIILDREVRAKYEVSWQSWLYIHILHKNVIHQAIKISQYQNYNREGEYWMSPDWNTIVHVLRKLGGLLCKG